jgi:hypothetical protein
LEKGKKLRERDKRSWNKKQGEPNGILKKTRSEDDVDRSIKRQRNKIKIKLKEKAGKTLKEE